MDACYVNTVSDPHCAAEDRELFVQRRRKGTMEEKVRHFPLDPCKRGSVI